MSPAVSICAAMSFTTGGATAFRDLGIEIQPKKGKALLFFPSFGGVGLEEGAPIRSPCDFRTLHAGAPNESKESKYIAQLWVRESPSYVPTVPEGSSQEVAVPLVQEALKKLHL